MTSKSLELMAEDPKRFLRSCLYHEKRIRQKREQIHRYQDIVTGTTQEIKEITTFSLTPSNKIERCVLEIVELEEQIVQELKALRAEEREVQEAILFLDEDLQRAVLEAKYLCNKTWEEIAVDLDISYRWCLRLHGKSLIFLQEKAREILNRPC